MDLDESENSGVSKKDTVGRQLLVISVPYKKGSHIVNKLTDFIPIIQQLQELHAKGYVHGDIRGFNVLFSENGGGGLIDFDFSGTPEKDSYPPGYALGQLMFTYHDIEVPSEAELIDWKVRGAAQDYWKKISEPPSEAKIIELIKTLEHLEQAGFTVEPNSNFQKEANSTRALNVTKQGATGSPLQV
jgi:serine/threonine protein kinase